MHCFVFSTYVLVMIIIYQETVVVNVAGRLLVFAFLELARASLADARSERLEQSSISRFSFSSVFELRELERKFY